MATRPASTAPTARASSCLREQALEIDRFNPHVAARLLGAFESWRILEPVRQARAKAVLEDLARRKLSTDSYEIVTKTLGGVLEFAPSSTGH